MPKIEIKSDRTGAGTTVFLDGNKVENLRSISFNAYTSGNNSVMMIFENIDVEIDGESSDITTLIDGKTYELKPV